MIQSLLRCEINPETPFPVVASDSFAQDDRKKTGASSISIKLYRFNFRYAGSLYCQLGHREVARSEHHEPGKPGKGSVPRTSLCVYRLPVLEIPTQSTQQRRCENKENAFRVDPCVPWIAHDPTSNKRAAENYSKPPNKYRDRGEKCI